MSLTGAGGGKTPPGQSLALRLLTLPGSGGAPAGRPPPPEPPQNPPDPPPNPPEPPKIHRARKTMAKPSNGQVPEKPRMSEMLHFRVSEELCGMGQHHDHPKRPKLDFGAEGLHKRLQQRPSPRQHRDHGDRGDGRPAPGLGLRGGRGLLPLL
ncbi:histone-lysine N-methyltransferase EHMT2-like [Camarhynchus parvulus]|uniref:histone-lysine N-methyltransferase EHMT2-like n=1 Tax=Geospiza parvula TaxID=87175 RepID=UPI00123838CD|nr:histone-lysine N-methyltransferase EHMT2-like [Camarhynchus parvulus]